METIALIERLDAEGQVLQMHRVHHWPQRLGRAVDNDLVIDDPHVAAHHAVLTRPVAAGGGGDAGGEAVHQQADAQEASLVQLTVGQTVNGVLFPAPRKRAPARHAASGQTVALASGSVFQVGGVLLRLRLPGELLAPELPLPKPAAHRPWTLPLIAAVGLAMLALDQWMQSNPGTPWLDLLTPVIAGPLGLGLWCAAWALLSKLFRGQFAFGPHLRIALPWVVGLSLLVPLLHQVSFALSWPTLSRITPLLETAGSTALVWQHLAWVLPRRRLHAAVAMATGFVAVTLFMGYNHYKHEQRWFSTLYATTLSLPALRLAPAVPLEDFVQSLRPLEAELARHAAEKDDDDDEPGDDGEAE